MARRLSWAAAKVGTALMLVASPALAQSPARVSPADEVSLTIRVVDHASAPVPRLNVFAVAAGDSAVVARGRTGDDGAVQLRLPPQRCDFGILSPRHLLTGMQQLAAGQLRLTGVSKEWKDQATQGIQCKSPKDCPASVWQRQCKVPSFWWLALLRAEPPDPGAPTYRWWDSIMRGLQAAERDSRR